MLHVTSGDSAARGIRQVDPEGEVLPWRDVLHEGPVPEGLSPAALREVRARFIAEQGWGDFPQTLRDLERRDAALAAASEGEVVLWFEHDLYDQLQLLQVLDRIPQTPPPRVRYAMIRTAEYLGSAAPERLKELFEAREAVPPEALALARRAWAAFRSPDPTGLVVLLAGDTSALPYLASALRRHLEEFPAVRDGLSRSERQALEAIAAEKEVIREAFQAAHHDREEAIFLGDIVFASYLVRLGRPPAPLVTFDDGSRIRSPSPREAREAFWGRRAALTQLGRRVLDRGSDLVEIGIDRWLGGVHLQGRRVGWRWDPAAGALVASRR